MVYPSCVKDIHTSREEETMAGNGTSPTLAAFLLELGCEGRSPRTLEQYRYIIERYEATGLEPLEYLANLNGKVALVTSRYHARALRYFFGWCVKHDLMESSPLAGLRFPEPPLPPKRPFSDEEVRRLLAACRTPRQRAILLVLFDTGIRASELANLRTADVDVEGGVLLIMGKGAKVRMVSVSGVALEALKECMDGANGTVFPELDHNHDRLHYLLECIAKRAGVQGAYPHRFRHTFASNFLGAGGDIGNLRLLLGHSTWAMSARYAAFYEQQRAMAAQRRLSSAARLFG